MKEYAEPVTDVELFKEVVFSKLIKYITERDLGFEADGFGDVGIVSIEDVKQVLDNIKGEYEALKRTGIENYAFDDGFDAGYIEGVLHALGSQDA